MKVINIRLDDEMIKELDFISSWEENDRTAIIRKLLRKAINKEKLEYAIKLYLDEKISIGKAVEIAGTEIWNFHDELRKRGISHPSDISELEKDFHLIKKT